jgi:hypothetical protein
MDKKYIKGTIALAANTMEMLDKAQAKMEKDLGVSLSRSQVIAILSKLYVDREI